MEKDEKKKISLIVIFVSLLSDHIDHVRGHQFSNMLNERQSNMD